MVQSKIEPVSSPHEVEGGCDATCCVDAAELTHAPAHVEPKVVIIVKLTCTSPISSNERSGRKSERRKPFRIFSANSERRSPDRPLVPQ